MLILHRVAAALMLLMLHGAGVLILMWMRHRAGQLMLRLYGARVQQVLMLLVKLLLLLHVHQLRLMHLLLLSLLLLQLMLLQLLLLQLRVVMSMVVLQLSVLLHLVLLVVVVMTLALCVGLSIGSHEHGGNPICSSVNRVDGSGGDCHVSQGLSEDDLLGSDCGSGRGDIGGGHWQVEAMSSGCSGGGIGVVGILEMLMQHQGHSRHGCAEVLVEVELGTNPHICELAEGTRSREKLDLLEVVVAD